MSESEYGSIYQYTYWTSVPKQGEDSGLLSILESDLVEFEKCAPFFDAFHASCGRAGVLHLLARQ
jgi:hypothetical protein